MGSNEGGLPQVGRRELLLGAGTLAWVSAGARAAPDGAAASKPVPDTPLPGARDEVLLTLSAAEQAFLTAAVDRLIPADARSPSASQAGVVTFIDRQLAGAWGSGARLYRSGPFRPGKPEHGYQLPLTPREFFAAGIAATDIWAKSRFGAPFERLPPAPRDEALTLLEHGEADLTGVSARTFFEALLAITIEGYFADPIYGGNRGKAGWKLLGFPGLPATYGQAVRSHKGQPYAPPPRSIEDFL